jgi:hypothetical protein
MYALSRERVYNCYLGNDVSTATRSRSMVTGPMSSNEHLAPASIFRHSGVMSQYNTIKMQI